MWSTKRIWREKHNRSKSSDVENSSSVIPPRRLSLHETRKERQIPRSPSLQSQSRKCNLHMFLKYTTPIVPVHCSPEKAMKGDQLDYTLFDLWESLSEWSAYGAGVPLLLDGSASIVQYYVPSLSGIQLYDRLPKSRGSNSDGKHGYKCDKGGSSSSDDSTNGNTLSIPFFEFFEHDRPHCRMPLTDKIMALASMNSKLKSIQTCDLLPISWICVAWYPIYRIPSGQTLNDLDASFLTYHLLSTPSRGNERSFQCMKGASCKEIATDGAPRISLPPFAMAPYKMKGNTWIHNETGEHKLVNSLVQAAENWLRFLHVNHPDFQFFASRRACDR